MKLCSVDKCTGCFACLNKCPKRAISIDFDSEGKTIPRINSEKCIECGVCSRVCPEIMHAKRNIPQKVYAAWSNDAEDSLLSSSGGMAASFARVILNNGGVVFGTSFVNKQARIIKIDKISDINKIRGSKYVQSFTGESFKEAEKALKMNEKVLYTGTPCQIAGLKNYLGREYPNLISVDLICHGTPPAEYLDDYVSHVIHGKEYDSVSFRGKYDWKFTVLNRERIVYQREAKYDLYYQAFLNALIYRDNCYQCQYSCPERVGDITIGDFWGLNRDLLHKQYDGNISLVMINSDKGVDFWNQISKQVEFEERNLSEAVNESQENLIHPSIAHPERERFISNSSDGFFISLKKTKLGKDIVRNYNIDKIRRTVLFRVLRKMKRFW